MSMGDFPESSSQAILVGIMFVGRLGVRAFTDGWGSEFVQEHTSCCRAHYVSRIMWGCELDSEQKKRSGYGLRIPMGADGRKRLSSKPTEVSNVLFCYWPLGESFRHFYACRNFKAPGSGRE